MKKIIKVSQYTKSGFSPEDAQKMIPIIDAALENMTKEDSIELDFENVKFFTTLFFNLTFARLLNNMSIEEYNNKIQIINLSEVGNAAYQHSLENAKQKSIMSNDEIDMKAKILAEIMDE